MTSFANLETSRPAFTTDLTAHTQQAKVDLAQVATAQTQVGEDEAVVAVGTNVKDDAAALNSLSTQEEGLAATQNQLYASLIAYGSDGKALEQFTKCIIQFLQELTRPSNTKKREGDEEKDEPQEDS